MTEKHAVPECLKKIAPLWSKHIENIGFNEAIGKVERIDNRTLNMDSHACCIVGEAHGFDDAYIHLGTGKYCKQCDKFALLFCDYDNDVHIEAFCKHMMEAHAKQ